jgi:hypothetical protein
MNPQKQRLLGVDTMLHIDPQMKVILIETDILENNFPPSAEPLHCL